MIGDFQCSVCIQCSQNVINVCENDLNNVQIIVKLQLCIPDIEWLKDYCICSSCLSQLDIVYSFRELCIQTEKVRRELLECDAKEDIKDIDEIQSRLEYESSDDKDFCQGVSDTEADLLLNHETFKCDKCKQKFKDENSLLEHSKNNHLVKKRSKRKPQFKCEKCGKKYTINTAFKKHLKICKENNGDNNKEQGESTKENPAEPNLDSASDIKEDTEVNENSSKTCNICGNSFANKYLLKRHQKNVHVTEKKYRCEICSSKFASVVYLNAHKRYHSRERKHMCAFCGKGFITASDLYHHEKIHANQRSYRCETCSKAFNTSSDLHKHKICVHLDRSQWKYECFYCQRKFPLKTNLDTHVKIHTGEKNFQCHLCEHRCINKSVLMRHIESHSNVLSYKCNVCLQAYKHKKSLDFHMSKVHGIGKVPEKVKKYFCHICPKSYFVNNKLQKHIRTHTGERPFTCPVCHKGFVDKSYVKQHLKMSHGQS